MRKLKAIIQIKAPVQTVQSLTSAPRRREWLTVRNGAWVRNMGESWTATEHDGGTRLNLEMAYDYRIPFLELFVADGFHHSVANSLDRLKAMAESPQ